MQIKYCKKCVFPETKPDLSFNEVEVNKFMMKSEKPEEPKTIKDFLNVKSTYKQKRRKIPIPKISEIIAIKDKTTRTIIS